MNGPDSGYTIADHEFRSDDAYAIGKYRLTERWLRQCGASGELYNIGCGAGYFNRLAVDLGFTVQAFEPDGDAHALAEADRPDGCAVHQKGLFEIEGVAVADVIVMHDVLEHIEDDVAAVDRIFELAKPNAVIVISVPAMPSLFGFHDEQLGHYRRYNRRMLRRVLEPKLHIERLRSYGMLMIPITFWYSRSRRRPYPVGATGSGGIVSALFEKVCALEERVPSPLGTSLVVLARPRSGRG